MTTILVTGGAGFIGSALCRRLAKKGERVICVDALTYAGHLETIKDLLKSSNFEFVRGDIRNSEAMKEVFHGHKPQKVIHLAAESHVDRSIDKPLDFVTTNVLGTAVLLDVCMQQLEKADTEFRSRFRFVHVSTDEVYGSLDATGVFTEDSPLAPNSPYAASKASSDCLVRAWFKTFGFPAIITHACNNYGPFQLPEKFIPVVIAAALAGREIPIYGNGQNMREWIYVDDHAAALDLVADLGIPGTVYNVSGSAEVRNLDLARMICRMLDVKLGSLASGPREKLISHVIDRPGHDQRYALSGERLKKLGWAAKTNMELGIDQTINWYLARQDWCEHVKRSFPEERQGRRAAL